MRKIILFSAGLFLIFLQCVYALDKDKKVDFDGEAYYLVFSDKIPSGGYLNQYVREGEDLNNCKKLIGVYHFPNLSGPKQAVINLSAVIAKGDNQEKYKIITGDKGEEALIDYFTWAEKEPLIAEFNIFRYVKRKDKQGVIAFQFCFRNYGPLTAEYNNAFNKNRLRWIELMEGAEIPGLLEYSYKTGN
ncbi:MAG: hypothetical protein WC357_08300 [Candidatus Omnitrophota bacterium]|jgi:hypothetical protein